jgi:hypothetical protein
MADIAEDNGRNALCQILKVGVKQVDVCCWLPQFEYAMVDQFLTMFECVSKSSERYDKNSDNIKNYWYYSNKSYFL